MMQVSAERASVQAEHHVHVAVRRVTGGVHGQRGGTGDGVERTTHDVRVGTERNGHGEHDEHAGGDGGVGEVAADTAKEHLHHSDGEHGAQDRGEIAAIGRQREGEEHGSDHAGQIAGGALAGS